MKLNSGSVAIETLQQVKVKSNLLKCEMKAAGVAVLIFIAAKLLTAKADGTCERFENFSWGSLGTLKICYMQTIAIDSKNFSITSGRDESVEGFDADSNKKLEHLPNNLGEKFPNLLGLDARDCSIKEVSKNHFKGLGKLQRLYLQDNQIEKIDDDVFEYVTEVEMVWLWNNRIKKLNGRAFASLHKLTWVDLTNNECIDESFDNATRIAKLPEVVTGKCGFTESEPSSTKIVKSEAELMAQSEELRALKLENAMLRIEKAKADLQIAHHNEIKAQHNEIKAQLKETCDARIELKIQENVNCSNDLQAKTAEINEKNEKIKQCEKKNQMLSGNGPF